MSEFDRGNYGKPYDCVRRSDRYGTNGRAAFGRAALQNARKGLGTSLPRKGRISSV